MTDAEIVGLVLQQNLGGCPCAAAKEPLCARHKAVADLACRIDSTAREEGIEEAMRAQCVYCRRRYPVDAAQRHYVNDGIQPRGESGRWVSCPAASVRALKSAPPAA